MIRVLLLLACVLVVGCGGAATSPSPTPVRTVAPSAAPAVDARDCAPIPAGVTVKTATMELAKGGVVQLALRPDKAPNT
ncbi:MAG: hypothetical protein E6I19_12960, partial [Chloroflexi bacterium]